MHAIPGNIAGMHVLEQPIPGSLQVDAGQAVLCGQIADDRAVLVHPRAHGIALIWLHEIRGHQHHALDVGQRALNQRFAVARVFVGQNVRFGHLRLIELPPNIVDANEHAHPIRVQIHYIRLPAGD